MFFLIRAAFYIGVVLLVMPPPKEGPQTDGKLARTDEPAGAVKRASAPRASADAAMAKAATRKVVPAKSTAGAAAPSKAVSIPSSDIAEYGAKAAAYCLRKPDVCRTAGADGIGERLSRGAGILSALIADAATAPATTGSLSRGTP